MTRERKLEVRALVKKGELSFQLIADLLGLTRSQVAGITFRDRHPVATRVDKNGNKRGSNRTQIGTGGHGPGLYPKFTAHTHEVRP